MRITRSVSLLVKLRRGAIPPPEFTKGARSFLVLRQSSETGKASLEHPHVTEVGTVRKGQGNRALLIIKTALLAPGSSYREPVWPQPPDCTFADLQMPSAAAPLSIDPLMPTLLVKSSALTVVRLARVCMTADVLPCRKIT